MEQLALVLLKDDRWRVHSFFGTRNAPLLSLREEIVSIHADDIGRNTEGNGCIVEWFERTCGKSCLWEQRGAASPNLSTSSNSVPLPLPERSFPLTSFPLVA